MTTLSVLDLSPIVLAGRVDPLSLSTAHAKLLTRAFILTMPPGRPLRAGVAIRRKRIR